jgi:hypothetical protein
VEGVPELEMQKFVTMMEVVVVEEGEVRYWGY